VNFEIYLDCLQSLKYDVIEWCIDVLSEVYNEVKVLSRNSIFIKANIVLRLLLGVLICEYLVNEMILTLLI